MLLHSNGMTTDGVLHTVADLHNLAPIRDFVEHRAAALGAPPSIAADLVLATDEAVTNVIEHGYRGQRGALEIEVRREAQDVVIFVRDHAPPFDLTSVPAPDLNIPLDEREPGGLGIFLIRQYTDQVSHRVMSQGGNELVLRKSIVA